MSYSFPRKQILRDLKAYLAIEMGLNNRNNAWPNQIANHGGVILGKATCSYMQITAGRPMTSKT